jgi:2-hydroxy-6-oxonona-2,4-dienedioate hydrolase
MTTTPAQNSSLAALPSTQVALRGLAGVPVTADVVDTGFGRPVVFLHGLVGLNDHWEDVARKVVPAARSVMLQMPLLDLEGDDCSIHGATELTIRFLEEYLRRDRAVLVGNSFGGHVALRIALDRPDLLRGLVLAGSSGLIEKTMVREVQIRPSREWLEEKIGELFFDRSKMRTSDVDRAHQELSQRGHARAMVKLSRSARRNHLGDRVGEIQAPTLLIWGKQDVVTPPEACHELQQKIRDCRTVWFDRCGHAPMIECPELFGDALGEFLSELDRRERSA